MFANEENLSDKIQHMAYIILEVADAVLVLSVLTVQTGGNYYILVVTLLPLL